MTTAISSRSATAKAAIPNPNGSAGPQRLGPEKARNRGGSGVSAETKTG